MFCYFPTISLCYSKYIWKAMSRSKLAATSLANPNEWCKVGAAILTTDLKAAISPSLAKPDATSVKLS